LISLIPSRVKALWRDERAAQLVEFAVSLPLLVVFVVGIFDFSNAFTLKQKLTNIARDAARIAAADPSSDLISPLVSTTNPNGLPASISDAIQAVANDMAPPNNINNCGLGVGTIYTTGNVEWTFTAQTTSPPCMLTVIINRAYYYPANTTNVVASASCTPTAPANGQTAVVATCVSIEYTYPWYFGRVAGLVGGTATLPTQVVGTAVAIDE
jgi:Flp pilus assembly protein TadG